MAQTVSPFDDPDSSLLPVRHFWPLLAPIAFVLLRAQQALQP
jgi:hypothetical protein